MILHPSAREYLRVSLVTTPAITTGWDASFDGGTTWIPGEADGAPDTYRWLIAGPDVAQGDAVVVLAEGPGHRVLFRATDNPEVVIRSSPIVVKVTDE